MNKLHEMTKEELQQLCNESNNFSDLCRKLGYSAGSQKTVKKKLEELQIVFSNSKIKRASKRRDEDIFVKNSEVCQNVLRKHYIKGNYTPYICAICGQEPIWNEKPLTLTLDHINGDNHDNQLENLRWVCPNCDRQLPTFGSKNTKNRIEKGLTKIKYCKTKEQQVCKECGKLLSSNNNKTKMCSDCYHLSLRTIVRPQKDKLAEEIVLYGFNKVGQKYNKTDNTIRKWCKGYGLPVHIDELKQYMKEIKKENDIKPLKKKWEVESDLIDLYLKTKTLSGVIEKYKIDYDTLKTILSNNNIHIYTSVEINAKNRKRILKIDPESHEVVGVYESIQQAADENNCDSSTVSRAARYNRIAKNFLWQFSEQSKEESESYK